MDIKCLAFLFGFLLIVGILKGQAPQEHCGARFPTQEQLLQEESNQPISEAHYRQFEATISVVVHILWQEEADNLSDEIIHSQIETLNRDFQKRNLNRFQVPDDFSPLMANIDLEFCLAQVDPDGASTSGITRTQTNVDCIGNIGEVKQGGKPRLHYTTLGGADAWDTRYYLNIWVAPNCNAFLGTATFPEAGPTEEDGVVIDPLYFGVREENSSSAPFHLGKTTTHEVGHYFNLLHTWGKRGCEIDDGVADTPMQEEEYRGCPIHPISSCDSPDMWMNFMNYVDDKCLMFFTEGQKQRMLTTLQGPRATLLEAIACASPTPLLAPPLTLFPNPTRDCIHVLLEPGGNEAFQLEVFDASGRKVFAGKIEPEEQKAIDVQSFAGGIYFVRAILDKVVYSGKILVLSNSF